MTEATIDTAPNAQTLPILETSEYDKYMLRTAAEVMMVLRGLRDRMAQITVFFNEGQDMLLTVLVAAANDHLIFDVGADEELNRRAVTADKHFCVTQLDKVRIQFLLGEFSRVTYEGRPALRGGLPRELLRLQRREFYRLITPIARPLKCRMALPAGAGEYLHEATIFDISGGGIGISAPPHGVPLAMDQQVSNCRIELPEVGLIECAVKVCNFFEITLKSGAHVKRAGCEYIKLPGPMATLVQRYIIKVERERKARESGLGF
jgi:flagellar brake protein